MYFSHRDELVQRIESGMILRITFFNTQWMNRCQKMECVTAGEKNEVIKRNSFKLNLRGKNAIFPIDKFSLRLLERVGQLLYFHVADNT